MFQLEQKFAKKLALFLAARRTLTWYNFLYLTRTTDTNLAIL
jgi:hypothetical protein